MNAPYTGENRRAPDRRVLPAAEASAAHFQRKAAEERADMLAEQLADCRAQVLPLEKQVDSLQIQLDSLHAQRAAMVAVVKDLAWRMNDIRDMLMERNGRDESRYGCDEWSTPTVNLRTAVTVANKAIAKSGGAA